MSGTRARIDRRDRIVEAAFALFTSKGVAQTRASDVARKARVDQPLVRYYFPTMDDLHLEVATRMADDANRFIAERIDREAMRPDEVLRAYVRGYFDWVIEKPGYGSLLLYFYYLASFKPEYTRANLATRSVGRERIAGMIFRAIEAKVIPTPSRPVDELAFDLQVLLVGGLTTTFTEPFEKPLECEAAVWRAVERLLGLRRSGT